MKLELETCYLEAAESDCTIDQQKSGLKSMVQAHLVPKRLNTTPLCLILLPDYAPFNQQKWSWTRPKCTCTMHFRPCAIDRLNRALSVFI